eukprot:scaffold118502_cov33-Phaeocystis_antarctica.AAC.1
MLPGSMRAGYPSGARSASSTYERPAARAVPHGLATDAGAETSAALSAADHRVVDHFRGTHRATSQM